MRRSFIPIGALLLAAAFLIQVTADVRAQQSAEVAVAQVPMTFGAPLTVSESVETFSNNPNFLAVTALGNQVDALQIHTADPSKLLRTLQNALESSAAQRDPSSFQIGPQRLIANALVTGRVPTLGFNAAPKPQVLGRIQDAVRRVQAEAARNPKVNLQLQHLAQTIGEISLRGQDLAEGNPTMASLNGFWDNGALRDSLNSQWAPGSTTGLLGSVDSRGGPFLTALPSNPQARLMPSRKVQNLGAVLARLNSVADKDVLFTATVKAVSEEHPELQDILNSRRTFLVRSEDDQEPRLLALLDLPQMSQQADANLRILISEQQETFPLLIVTLSRKGTISQESLKKLLVRTASAYSNTQDFLIQPNREAPTSARRFVAAEKSVSNLRSSSPRRWFGMAAATVTAVALSVLNAGAQSTAATRDPSNTAFIGHALGWVTAGLILGGVLAAKFGSARKPPYDVPGEDHVIGGGLLGMVIGFILFVVTL